MRKRILPFATAMMMLSSLTLPVYAENADEDVSPEDIPVTVTDVLAGDEAEFMLPSWCEWSSSTGTLTLKDQLPDTTDTTGSLADIAGISPELIKKIVIRSGTKAGTSAEGMFNRMSAVTEITGLTSLDTSNVTNMRYMFNNCSSLTSLDLSSFNTSKVTDMGAMFNSCQKLTSLDVSGFDTSKVKSISSMFSGCSALTSLDITGLDTSSAEYMVTVFFGCSSLPSLDVTGFDTANTRDMAGMFRGCASLTTLDLSSFDTSNVSDMEAMLSGCSSLTSLDISGFDTSGRAYMGGLLSGTDALVSIKLPLGFDTNGKYLVNKDASYLGWAKSGTLDIISGDGEQAEFVADTTGEYVRLTKEDLSWYIWDRQTSTLTLKNQLPDTTDTTGSLADIAGISPELIKKIVIRSGTKAGTSAEGMFNRMSSVTEIAGLANLDTSNITNMRYMFSNCSSLTSLDLSSFDTGKVTDMGAMFNNCQKLTSLDVSGFNTSKVKSISGMFSGCSDLTSLDITGLDTSSVEYMSTVFYGCSSLESLDVTGFDTANTRDMAGMFRGCASLTTLDLSSFDTSNVSDMEAMLSGCSSLTSLDISGFDTSGRAYMGGLLSGTDAIVSIKLPLGFDTNGIYLVNKDASYLGWAKSGTVDIISGDGEQAVFVADTAGEYVRLTAADIERLSRPAKPTPKINAVFGGRTVQLNCTDTDAEIYYNFGSSNITTSCRHIKPGESIFLNEPMTGTKAAMYFKAYKNGKWSELGKWGVLNVQIDKPIIVQSGPKSKNTFRIYTQTKDSYIVLTFDGSDPSIQEGTQQLKVTNGRIVWGTSTVETVPKGRTIKAIAVRSGLVTSEVAEYTNS